VRAREGGFVSNIANVLSMVPRPFGLSTIGDTSSLLSSGDEELWTMPDEMNRIRGMNEMKLRVR
jgi:hypothetical protein